MGIVIGILSGIAWWQLAYMVTLVIPGSPMNYWAAILAGVVTGFIVPVGPKALMSSGWLIGMLLGIVHPYSLDFAAPGSTSVIVVLKCAVLGVFASLGGLLSAAIVAANPVFGAIKLVLLLLLPWILIPSLAYFLI
jgi:hypothetical protein